MQNQPNIRQNYRTVRMVRPPVRQVVVPKNPQAPKEKSKIKWWLWAIIAAVPVICLVGSYFKGRAAFQGCLWATVLSIIAGGLSLLPIIYSMKSKSASLLGSVLASSAIRVLVILIGAIIFIFLVKITTRWFPAWLGLFYLLMLSFDVWLILRKQNT
jgi:hypothetical protein